MKSIIPFLLFLLVAVPGFAAGELDAWAHAIGSGPHRLTGTEASKEATDYIKRSLEEQGVDGIIEQVFPTLQTRVDSCYLESKEAGRFDLHPLRENAILAPSTGAEGIEGILHHGLPDRALLETGPFIVILDGKEGNQWRDAFSLGAVAVIFTGENRFYPQQLPHVNAPVNLPRFYFEGAAQSLPLGKKVRLVSRINWETVQGRNLYIFVEGTRSPDEVIIVSAQMDSLGIVPRLSPGGWNALNTAALMEMAVRFSEKSAGCSLLFAFLDGDSRGLSGSLALHDLVSRKDPANRFDLRMKSIHRERAFLGEMLAAISKGIPADLDSGLRRILFRQLKLIALEELSQVEEALSLARGRTSLPEADLTELDEARASWTGFLRNLDLGNVESIDTVLFDSVINELRSNLEQRSAEVDRLEEELVSGKPLLNLVAARPPALHVSLAFGDSTSRWGIFLGGRSGWRSSYDLPGLYGRLQRVINEGANRISDPTDVDQFLKETVNGHLSAGSRLWGPQVLVHSGEVAGQFGIFNCVAGTSSLSLPDLGTRFDRVEQYDIPVIEGQVEQFIALLREVLSGPGLGLRRAIWPDVRTIDSGFDENLRPTGPQVWERNLGRMVSVRPLAGAVIQVTPQPVNEEGDPPLLNVPWYDEQRLVASNGNGAYRVPGISLDDEQSYGIGAIFEEDGSLRMISTLETSGDLHVRLNMVKVQSGWLSGEPALRDRDLKLMAGRSNSMLEGRRSFFGNFENWIFWHVEPDALPVKVFGTGLAVNLRQDTESPSPTFDTRQSAVDLWELNESRLRMLEEGGIVQGSLRSIHNASAEWLQAAESAPDTATSSASFAMGFWTEGPVYERIMSALNDIVVAVLFLLLLTIPFAVALERLVIGAVSIQGRIAGFTGFFLAAFLGFYLTHPAFNLSPAPLIIFLGFGILLLSIVVITILIRRFESEILKLQGLAGSVHGDQVSRIGTIAAAMQMGVSTMRRRPMRTGMSILTVFLLTFAILIFASFDSSLGIVKKFVRPLPAYSGVSIMKPDRSELPPRLLDKFEALYPDAVVCERLWLVQEKLGGETWPLVSMEGSRQIPLRGILGLGQSELLARPDLQELLDKPDSTFADSVWISDVLGERMRAGPGDTVRVNGIPLTVRGVLKRSRLAGIGDLMGEGILPVDFTTIEEETESSIRNSATATPRPRDILPPDSVVIVPAEAARRMGASLRVVNIYPGSLEEAESIAGQLAGALELPVIATRADGVYWHTLGIVVQASGLGQLVVPMILGALVIFGTLLGSVVDREREIYTFSALGLAPTHVASLFLAESLIYAIVGGVAGFLGTQGFVMLLDWVATARGWAVPSMNYSSLNSIVSLLALMGTVLVSAVYPAIRASRSANPGLMRQWRMPEPEGDLLEIAFPFTVSSMDYQSVLGFLYEHFENFKDSSLGSFMTWDACFLPGPDDQPILECQMALTPYDLGVTQFFHMESRPGDIEGIEEIHFRLQRLSGQPGNWKRLNKRLLHDLRRQMLLWRTLTPARMEHYRTLAATHLGKKPATSIPDNE